MFMKIQKTTEKKTNNKKVLMVFDDMIADMESNKQLSPIAIELL